MTKGRKTTQAEIVAFCIEHGKDYLLTIKTFGVSYQQIYAWVRKYEEKGVDGLADGRGRTKPESEMDELESCVLKTRFCRHRSRTRKWRLRC